MQQEVGRIINEEELKSLSNEKLLELIKDRGVFLNMYDGTMNEIRVKDIVGDDYSAKILDFTGLSFFRQAIRCIEILV